MRLLAIPVSSTSIWKDSAVLRRALHIRSDSTLARAHILQRKTEELRFHLVAAAATVILRSPM